MMVTEEGVGVTELQETLSKGHIVRHIVQFPSSALVITDQWTAKQINAAKPPLGIPTAELGLSD